MLLVMIGLACLMFGGDSLARGAASLALNLHINPVVVGLTVVSIATSMPELFTAMLSTWEGNPDLTIGNIVGSNLGNIGLIMGLTALIYPIRIQSRLILKEIPILLVATLLFSAVCFNQLITRVDGLLLVLAMAGYLGYLVKSAKEGKADADVLEEIMEEIPHPTRSVWACLGFIIFGTVLLALGADLLVGGAVEMASRLGVSNALIGLTLVAIGTSLPELAASIAAARRKQSSICAGNIVGSNIFNILFVGGGVSIVIPVNVDIALFQIEFPAMLLMTALLWLIYTTDKLVTRFEGVILLVVYFLIILLSTSANFERMGALTH